MEMSFCTERGIPHSEFLSWSIEDREKTMAFLLEQSLTCMMCGTAEWQWEENKFAFMPVENWCKGCYLKSVSSEEAGTAPGTTIALVPTTPERLAEQEEREKRRARMKAENEE